MFGQYQLLSEAKSRSFDPRRPLQNRLMSVPDKLNVRSHSPRISVKVFPRVKATFWRNRMTNVIYDKRFEERLTQSPIVTQMRTVQGEHTQKLDGLEKRMDGLDQRMGRLEHRFDQLTDDFHGLGIRFEAMEGKLDTVLEILENHSRILMRHDRFEGNLENHEIRLAAVERAYRDLVGKAH